MYLLLSIYSVNNDEASILLSLWLKINRFPSVLLKMVLCMHPSWIHVQTICWSLHIQDSVLGTMYQWMMQALSSILTNTLGTNTMDVTNLMEDIQVLFKQEGAITSSWGRKESSGKQGPFAVWKVFCILYPEKVLYPCSTLILIRLQDVWVERAGE